MPHPLVELFRSAEVNSFASSALAASALTENELLLRFEEQRKGAPHRALHRPYFRKRTGKTTSGRQTNRREEHLAIALWSAYRVSGFALPDGTILFPVDSQLPPKSHRDEANLDKWLEKSNFDSLTVVFRFLLDESTTPSRQSKKRKRVPTLTANSQVLP